MQIENGLNNAPPSARLTLEFTTAAGVTKLADLRFDAGSFWKYWAQDGARIHEVPAAIARCFLEYVHWKFTFPERPFFFKHSDTLKTLINATQNTGRRLDEVFGSHYRELWTNSVSRKKPFRAEPLRVNELFLPPHAVAIFWERKRVTTAEDVEELYRETYGEAIASNRRVSIPQRNDLPLIGHDMHIDAGIRLLDKTRLVTAHAISWSGKTRVLLEIAKKIARTDLEANVVYVDVNYTASADQVGEKVQTTIGLPVADKRTPELLGSALSKVGKTLLILDNFEQVGVWDPNQSAKRVQAETVQVWLDKAPELKILVGCWWALGLEDIGEKCLPITPVDYPRPAEVEKWSEQKLRETDGFRIFIQYATLFRKESDLLKPANIRLIGHVISKLRGHPGSIKVAAKLLKHHDLEWLQKSYSRVFSNPKESLVFGLNEVFKTLSPTQRVILLQAARFRGGFDLAGATAVIADEKGKNITKGRLSAELDNLVDTNLLNHMAASVDNGWLEERYGFETPVEIWLEEKWLAGSGISASAQEKFLARFSEYYCSLFEAQSSELEEVMSPQAAKLVCADRENLSECHRRAWERGDTKTTLRAVFAMAPLLRLQGPASLLLALIRDTLKHAKKISHSDNAKLLKEQANCLFELGDYAQMVDVVEQAIDHAQKAADKKLEVRCFVTRADLLRVKDGTNDGRVKWPLLVKSLRDTDDLESYSNACRELARVYDWNADPDKAFAVIDDAIKAYEQKGIFVEPVIENKGLARLLNMRGLVAWHCGKTELAEKSLNTALSGFKKQQHPVWIAGITTNLALVHIDQNRLPLATQRISEAEVFYSETESLGFHAVNKVAMARLLCRRRAFEDAVLFVQNVEAFVEGTAFYENKVLLRSLHGIALEGAGRHSEALKQLETAVKDMRHGSSKMRRYFETLVVAARTALKLGKTEYARGCLKKAEDVARQRAIDGKYPVLHYRALFREFLKLSRRASL